MAHFVLDHKGMNTLLHRMGKPKHFPKRLRHNYNKYIQLFDLSFRAAVVLNSTENSAKGLREDFGRRRRWRCLDARLPVRILALLEICCLFREKYAHLCGTFWVLKTAPPLTVEDLAFVPEE